MASFSEVDMMILRVVPGDVVVLVVKEPIDEASLEHLATRFKRDTNLYNNEVVAIHALEILTVRREEVEAQQ